MAQTLTILRLGVPPTLARALRSANPIVHDRDLPSTLQERQALAGRHDGAALCAAGMLEAGHQFRRVNGHLHLPKLHASLEAHFRNVSAAGHNEARLYHDHGLALSLSR